MQWSRLTPFSLIAVSEMIGRRPVYMISMFFYFIFTLPSALANNIGTMLVCRLVSRLDIPVVRRANLDCLRSPAPLPLRL